MSTGSDSHAVIRTSISPRAFPLAGMGEVWCNAVKLAGLGTGSIFRGSCRLLRRSGSLKSC